MAQRHIGEAVLPTQPERFAATVSFFQSLEDGNPVGGARIFQMEEIFPADDPRECIFVGAGMRVRLVRQAERGSNTLSVGVDHVPSPASVDAPNGTTISFTRIPPSAAWHDIDAPHRHEPIPLERPPLDQRSVVISRAGSGAFGKGRAGMLYRDLVPCRLGGAFIGSEINIAEDGPVPDFVHYHLVSFQTIYCVEGWVKLVYEGQGEPFLLKA